VYFIHDMIYELNIADGGLKRLRIYGHPFAPPSPSTSQPGSTPTLPPTIPLLPLTYEAFKPYGQVIQGYSFPSSAPKGIHVTTANQGTASKFHRLAKITHSYPDGMLKRGGMYIGSVRSESRLDIKDGKKLPVETLER
jgi:allantoicase